MPENNPPLPDFTRWPSFPFEGELRVKHLAEPVDVEPPRSGEDSADCVACNTPDDSYIWVSERWRVRGMDRPTGLPMVLILECRSHLDIGDLPNLLAAELGVMTVRLERAIRSLDGVARVHVNRWGDGSAHLHMWFLARPYGRLQLRGTFLSLWDDILPVIPEEQWLENLALVAAWLAEFGGRAIAEPPHIHWQSPSTFSNEPTAEAETTAAPAAWRPTSLADTQSAPADGGGAFSESETRDLSATAARSGAMADDAASTAVADDATSGAVIDDGASVAVADDGAATATGDDVTSSVGAGGGASTATDDDAGSVAVADDGASAAMTDDGVAAAMADDGASNAVTDDATPTAVMSDSALVAGLDPHTPTPAQDASASATDPDAEVRGPATEERAADEPREAPDAADEDADRTMTGLAAAGLNADTGESADAVEGESTAEVEAIAARNVAPDAANDGPQAPQPEGAADRRAAAASIPEAR